MAFRASLTVPLDSSCFALLVLYFNLFAVNHSNNNKQELQLQVSAQNKHDKKKKEKQQTNKKQCCHLRISEYPMTLTIIAYHLYIH